ncbi:MAG: Kelch repeat-containing protein [Candidatus Thorarchaeota archaeon]
MALNPGSSPSPRTLFSMIYNNNKKVYLYDGIGESFTKTWNDFWVFDFNSNTWEQIISFSLSLIRIWEYWWIFVIIRVAGITGNILLKNKLRDNNK